MGMILLVCVAAFAAFLWNLSPRKLSPPSLVGLPILGAALDFIKFADVMPSFILEKTQEFGFSTWGVHLIRFGVLPEGVVVLTRAEDVEHVLCTNFSNYVKGDQFKRATHELFGNGIFANDGDKWKFHRKVASRMFSRRLMINSGAVMSQYVDILVNRLKSLPPASSSSCPCPSSTAFDLQHLFFCLTIDVFVKVAFGVDLGSLESGEQHPFAVSFDLVQTAMNRRFFNPWYSLCKWLGTDDERCIRDNIKVLNDFAIKVIDSRRREMDNQSGSLGPDLISRFLDAAKSRGEDVDVSELKDIVMNFIIAGRDTTACALSWTVHELIKSPLGAKHLEIIRDEVATSYPTAAREGGGIGEAWVDKLSSSTCLPYLHACIMESLRLHPSVPKQVKYAVRDDVLPDGTKIGAGTGAVYSAYTLNRNPKVWDRPSEFDPTRWLVSPSPPFLPITEPSHTQFITFNAGPRLCLGKGLAMMELKMVLSRVLCEVDLTPVFAHTDEYRPSFVLPMMHGLQVTCSRVCDRTTA